MHEAECTFQSIHDLRDKVESLEKTVALLVAQVTKLQKANPHQRTEASLDNFNCVNDIDDLIENKEFMDGFWSKVTNKAKTVPLFLRLFFAQKTCKRFYAIKAGKVNVKGMIGRVGKKSYGVDGAVTSFTWYGFYDAFVPGICDLIQLYYGDWLYEHDISDSDKRIKQDLVLGQYYKPERDDYRTDAQFRDACRHHKAVKVETVAILQSLMDKTS